MARAEKSKQINFIPADDVAGDLEKCENKTKTINEALRMYFSTGPLRLDIVERLQNLEDFQQRFMAYYARKDNELHSEFCDCKTCISNRKAFAGTRIVTLDPEPQTFEKVLSIIERAVEQAKRMNAIVVFDGKDYNFRITANTNAHELYGQYMNSAQTKSGNSVSVTMPNPWLK